jgi:hypothetical protein
MFVIHYDTRESVNSKEQIGELMKLFGERGEIAGTVAHYVYPGGGGMVIVDTEDLEALYEAALVYSPWLDLEVRPILNIDSGVSKIVGWLSG